MIKWKLSQNVISLLMPEDTLSKSNTMTPLEHIHASVNASLVEMGIEYIDPLNT